MPPNTTWAVYSGILLQVGPDGKEHPIAYWSDTLTPRASFWSAYKRELFTLISV